MKHQRTAQFRLGLIAAVAMTTAVECLADQDIVVFEAVQVVQARPVPQQLVIRNNQVINARLGRGVVLDDPTGQRSDGFQVAGGGADLGDTAAGEAITHLNAEDWFKAIAAIEQLETSEDNQMVIDPSGVLRPVSSLRRTLIEALPEEGRKTFRMLNGPAAQAKLAEALAMSDLNERAMALEEILNRYALCDAAAGAASALGDLRFEAGRFEEAVDLYAAAATHVGSKPDDAALMAKRLHALARAEHWTGFGELAEYARFRHAQTSVELGSEQVKLADVIQTLADARGQAPDRPTFEGQPLALPDSSYPTFSVRLTDQAQQNILQAGAAQNRYGSNMQEILHPLIVADENRLYALNVNGLIAYDAKTGSELWNNANPVETANQIVNNLYYLQMDYQQALVHHGNTLLVTNTDPQSMNWSRLRAVDASTGEVRWQSNSAGELSNFSFVGRPLAEGDTLYSVVRDGAGNQLKLVCVSLNNASLRWAVDLGSAPSDPEWNSPVDVVPRIAMGERYVMVLTNNGAVIAVDPQTQAVAWAYAYPILPTTRSRRGMSELSTPGEIVCHDGVVYSKDTRDDRLHAIRERDAVRLWSAQIEKDATIVHADDRHLYLLGKQLTAVDYETGQPAWWSPHAGNEAGTPVFTAGQCIVLGNRRTCRIDLTNGKVLDYRNDLTTQYRQGGLARVGSALGFIDSDWIRVYRVDTQREEQEALP